MPGRLGSQQGAGPPATGSGYIAPGDLGESRREQVKEQDRHSQGSWNARCGPKCRTHLLRRYMDPLLLFKFLSVAYSAPCDLGTSHFFPCRFTVPVVPSDKTRSLCTSPAMSCAEGNQLLNLRLIIAVSRYACRALQAMKQI